MSQHLDDPVSNIRTNQNNLGQSKSFAKLLNVRSQMCEW